MTLQIGPAAFAPGEQLRVSRLGLREPALGPGHLLLDLGGRAPDLLVGTLSSSVSDNSPCAATLSTSASRSTWAAEATRERLWPEAPDVASPRHQL